MCVCSTHIEPRGGKTKVKARVHAFGWEIEKRGSQDCFSGEQKDKQTLYVLSPFHFAFSFLLCSSARSLPLLLQYSAEGSSFKGEQPLSAF